MVGAIALLFVFQLVGEAIHRLVGVPVPGAVIGMVLLVVWLALRPVRWGRPGMGAGQGRGAGPGRGGESGRLEAVTAWLTAHLSVMFVPAAVGVMEQGAMFARFGLALMLATAVSGVLTIVGTALVLRWALARFAPDEAAA